MANNEIDFIIQLLKKVKQSQLINDKEQMEKLWYNIFIYAANQLETEVKIDLLSKIDINVKDLKKILSVDVPIIIDYSFVQDEDVRNKLFADCLEMSKYRYGKINNHINFEEYCRYAIMQIELLFNYYINIKDLESYFSCYNPRFDLKETHNRAEDLTLETKIISIQNQFNIKGRTKNLLFNIKKVRNNISHRSSYQEKKEDEILKRYLEKGLNKKSFHQLNSGTDREIFNEGKYIEFKRAQRWEEVDDTLSEYVTNIKENLMKYHGDETPYLFKAEKL